MKAGHSTNASNKKQTVQQKHDYESVVSILQKKDRSMKDLEMLHSKISMLDGFHMFIENYFQGSDIAEQIKLCGDLVYEKKNKGEVIFEQGEQSNNKLYIILTGSCHLFLLKDLDFEEDPEFKRKLEQQKKQDDAKIKTVSLTILSKLKIFGSKFKRQLSMDYTEKNLTAVEINKLKTRFGKTTRLITAGSSFGERALLTSQPRTATIVADSHPTELIVLDRDKFEPALEELKRTLQLRRDILFQIFKDMDNYSSARLESMLYSFQVSSGGGGYFYKITWVQNYSRGHLITEQDMVDDRFYIIAEGEAQIQKKIQVPAQGAAGKQGKMEDRIVKLSTIGAGVMVGDEIMLGSAEKGGAYSYTSEIISIKASLLVADKKIIDRKFPKDLKDYLRMQSFYREKGRKLMLEKKKLEIHMEDERNKSRLGGIASASSNGISALSSSLTVGGIHSVDEYMSPYEMVAASKSMLNAALLESAVESNSHLIEVAPDGTVSGVTTQVVASVTGSSHQQDKLMVGGLSEKQSQQQQQVEEFNIKDKVFDFGDGKNVENAERIDRIFRVKHQRSRKATHFTSDVGFSTLGTSSKNQEIYLKHARHRDIFAMSLAASKNNNNNNNVLVSGYKEILPSMKNSVAVSQNQTTHQSLSMQSYNQTNETIDSMPILEVEEIEENKSHGLNKSKQIAPVLKAAVVYMTPVSKGNQMLRIGREQNLNLTMNGNSKIHLNSLDNLSRASYLTEQKQQQASSVLKPISQLATTHAASRSFVIQTPVQQHQQSSKGLLTSSTQQSTQPAIKEIYQIVPENNKQSKSSENRKLFVNNIFSSTQQKLQQQQEEVQQIQSQIQLQQSSQKDVLQLSGFSPRFKKLEGSRMHTSMSVTFLNSGVRLFGSENSQNAGGVITAATGKQNSQSNNTTPIVNSKGQKQSVQLLSKNNNNNIGNSASVNGTATVVNLDSMTTSANSQKSPLTQLHSPQSMIGGMQEGQSSTSSLPHLQLNARSGLKRGKFAVSGKKKFPSATFHDNLTFPTLLSEREDAMVSSSIVKSSLCDSQVESGCTSPAGAIASAAAGGYSSKHNNFLDQYFHIKNYSAKQSVDKNSKEFMKNE